MLDAVQTALDVLGIIPGFGTPFDLANATISMARGDAADAALRLVFAVPGLGDGAQATHLAGEVGSHFGDDAVRVLERACGANSFSADTLVATPDGEQPISTLQVGDLVLAYNQETGSTGAYTVTAVLVHDDPAQLHLTIDGETLDTTPEHPFYTLLRGWVAATALRVGDQVQREDGSYGAVEALRLDPTPRRMYNLTVAGAHTFFVGEQRWLVHNANCGFNLKSRPFAESSELNRRVIEQMYRGKWVSGQWKSADSYAGGLSGAIRRQSVTGELVGGKDHFRKGWQRLTQLKGILKEGRIDSDLLSAEDLKIVRVLHDDLLKALQGK